VASPAVAKNLITAREAYARGDYVTAIREARALAEHGDHTAQSILGKMDLDGDGVPQDLCRAMKFYRRAAGVGFMAAWKSLGVMHVEGRGVPQDNVIAHMWFNLAAGKRTEGAAKHRDILAKRMTPAAIEEVQRLACECLLRIYTLQWVDKCGR